MGVNKDSQELVNQSDEVNNKKDFIDINKYVDNNVGDVPFFNKTLLIGGGIIILVAVIAISIVFLVIFYC